MLADNRQLTLASYMYIPVKFKNNKLELSHPIEVKLEASSSIVYTV